MNYDKIEFLPIKKYHGNYISYSHYDNKKIAYLFKDVKIEKSLYRKNKKIYIKISMKNNIKEILEKLKEITINHIQKKFNYKEIEKNYISILEQINDKYILEVEIHPDCIFKKMNQMEKKEDDNYINIKQGDTINIVLEFRGILFGKNKYKNLLLVNQIVRLYEEPNNIDDCVLSNDEESDENLNIYSKKYENRFKKLFENKSEYIVKDIVKSIINNIV